MPVQDPAVLIAENEQLRAQVARLNRFFTIVEGADQLIAEIDAQGRVAYLNPAAQRYFGYEPAECLGMPLLEFLHPDDRPSAQRLLAEWIQSRQPGTAIEYRIKHRDGTVLYTLWTLTPHYDDTGSLARATAIVQDVSELRRATEELVTFKSLIELAPDGIAITDLQLTITYANLALHTMLGYPSLVGMSALELVHPPDRETFQAIVELLPSNHRQELQTIRYARHDGALMTAQSAAIVLRDRQGNPIGFGLTTLDISERIEAAETLRRSEQRNRDLINAIPDLMFVLSADGTFLDYKTDPTGTLLLPPEAFLGRRVTEVMPLPIADQVMSHIEALLRTGIMQTFTYQLPINDQIEEYEARMTLSNSDILILSRNVTGQRRAEREREAMKEQIIQAQQAALRELSTPLLPIADGVVVMPLIGAIDSNRAQQIMETLLYGVAEYNAQVAIVDITGVKVVDTQVAGALIRAAQALRMLGAQVVLTGISPEIAQTMVHIGAELRDMITKATLQDGIRYALDRSVATKKVAPRL